MQYKGYEIDPKFIVKGAIEWKSTGPNGSIIIGTKDGKQFFIKKNTNVVYPSEGCSPAMYETYKEQADWIESKQKSLRSLMSGLSFDKDHVAIEEDNFWDKEDNRFVTITRFLKGALDDKHDFSKDAPEKKKELFIKMTELVGSLHDHKVIHGDLKEGNFLYLPKGSSYDVYIIDFDASYPSENIPWPVRVPYTPGYESPEIVIYQGKAEADDDTSLAYLITPATDIFTLGLIFHKVWTFDMPGYATEDASFGIAVATVPGVTPVLNHSLDVQIGPKNGATYISLINWMLTRMPGDRPTAKQVLEVLNDNAIIPAPYVVGSDVAPFTGLWESHKNLAAYDEDKLKEKGILSFQKINEGGLKYLVRTADSEERYTIHELIKDGILEEKEAEICEPWEEDGIEFASKEEFKKNQISVVRRIASSTGNKMYETISVNGVKSYKTYKSFISMGLAKVKVVIEEAPEGFELWDDHKDSYHFATSSFLASRHITRISPQEFGGEEQYRISYDNGNDDKVLSLKTMQLLGLILKN